MSDNRFGLDVNYHSGVLKQVLRGIENYTPEEYARALLRMVNVTAPVVMQEKEFKCDKLARVREYVESGAECRAVDGRDYTGAMNAPPMLIFRDDLLNFIDQPDKEQA